ncbi:MAG: cupin domain-containing protein [Bryobacteraceae bacterium]
MHQTVRVWSFIPKFSIYEETKGTYLEAVEEFTLAPGVRAEPHYHDTHEFFYILEGSAVIQIEKEARICRAGDFIRIPRKAVHTGKALGDGVARWPSPSATKTRMHPLTIPPNYRKWSRKSGES